ncbi:hypothetical protein NQ315_009492 [Exocentrus adspersus]|uniref:Ig-like domain-containing protein n=1 Tax=Exocentrus adspersus TaxID=1586481 RepID=A0AAV8WH44_9CUCU|nr:hypothetical protein NQ315_009492 [Exocentrus adspersus]
MEKLPTQLLGIGFSLERGNNKEKERIPFDIVFPPHSGFKEAKKISSIDGLKDRAVPKWENNNVNVLTISPAREGDAGNYTCTAYDTATARNESANFIAARTIAVNVPNNINVVEEERLRIECEVKGNPELHWIYQNETFDKSRDRVILEDYTKDNKVIRNGAFIIEKITMEDRGTVVCVGEDLYTKETSEDECTVRIKDKYAALWPFLGICAEVIVLCAIIVIYEKKRNKTELEESDTDQSPDQKNTPDHGKEANLRHRQ